MNRKKFWYIMITYCVIVLIVGIIMGMETMQAKEQKEVDLSISPNEVLFDVPNMKPGDWATRSIRVNNNNDSSFFYYINSEFNEGSEKLYRALQLTVKVSEKVLYNGSLSEFTGEEKRILAGGGTEQVQYVVRFPEELGNDYQGLNVKMKFVFYAGSDNNMLDSTYNKEKDTSNVHADHNKDSSSQSTNGKHNSLPNTGSANRNIMFILLGSGLITFAILLWWKRIEN
ncbi:LPXTG cell wall anchor domain-containing protein [Bacillus gaemokensis]|uniref:Gram-positive cocci surface proteins LPxTG domain-containing protein n=1 Tax=Bacillus gaemokensis TaxID=574375 RepID=A0A073KMH3_9BACI|nr:LPXTG cell wall anchor domain-containing protein [Bacillus gaemokensis]KEK23553.1 hypothetical protein BAGA_07445 [Bacillus gaemokensis]KYG26348.1 hypothetical protein AZF08_16280 [Bacillus gaemokensis]